MGVFFDTEFNGYREESRLLSIGLAAEDGRECYLELPKVGPHLEGANPFVRATVLGQFGRLPGCQANSLAEMGRQVWDFLDGFETTPALYYDYKLDLRHLEHVLMVGGDPPWRERVRFIDAAGWMNEPSARPAIDAVLAGFRERGIGQHHTLVDACCMRAAMCTVSASACER